MFSVCKVSSVREPCAKCFVVHVLKFEIWQITWRKWNYIRLLVFSFSSKNLAFWCFWFCFFMWFANFQILICEPQSIWRKLLVQSWLYKGLRFHCATSFSNIFFFLFQLETKKQPFQKISIEKNFFGENYVSKKMQFRIIWFPYKKCVTEKWA